MRNLLRALGALGLILLVALGVLFLRGSGIVDHTYEVSVQAVEIPDDSASVAHGEYLTTILGCRDCHGPTLAGQVMVDEPPFRAVATNLTPGGVGGPYSTEDWVRSIRHGVVPSGRGVHVMPSYAYHYLADEELGALIAYLHTVPAARTELPATEIRPLGRILTGLAGAFEPVPEHMLSLEPVPLAEPGPTVEYGRYRATTTCVACHGENLLGAQPAAPGSPFAPSLAPVGKRPFEDFENAMRRGVAADGHAIDPGFMPWSAFQAMTDDELRALYAYLQELPDGA